VQSSSADGAEAILADSEPESKNSLPQDELASDSETIITSTAGITLPSGQSRGAGILASMLELLSSMRFAVSLLTLIAIASVIGTVLKQNEPMPNYVNQFGPFWFEIFSKLSLYSLYSAWWFY